MNYALDQGIQFWDTAELYPVPTLPELYGDTERIIGNWLSKNKKRSELVLATKIAGKAPFTKHIRTTDFTPEAINQAISASLGRLQTDYIDLYQLHWPTRNTNFFGKRDYPIEAFHSDEWKDNIYEVLVTLQSAIKAGRIRYIGLSNETPWGVMRFLEEYKKDYKTLFIDIDGTLITNSSIQFPPYVGEGSPLTNNISYLKNLHDTGKVYIILTTSRPEFLRQTTEDEMKRHGIPYDQLVMGLPHCKRIVINDFARSNTYPSCEAINIPRNNDNLSEYL